MSTYLPMDCPKTQSNFTKFRDEPTYRGDDGHFDHKIARMCVRLVFFNEVAYDGASFSHASRTVFAPRKTDVPFDSEGERPYENDCWIWPSSYPGARDFLCFQNLSSESICWKPGGSESYYGWDGSLPDVLSEEMKDSLLQCDGFNYDVFLLVSVWGAWTPRVQPRTFAGIYGQDVTAYLCGPYYKCEGGASS